MALYEIVLRFRDREETRLTDHNRFALGKDVHVGARRFRVASLEPPASVRADARIVLEPASERASGDRPTPNGSRGDPPTAVRD